MLLGCWSLLLSSPASGPAYVAAALDVWEEQKRRRNQCRNHRMCRSSSIQNSWNDMIIHVIRLTSTSIMIPSCAGWRMLLTNRVTLRLFLNTTPFSVRLPAQMRRHSGRLFGRWLFTHDSPMLRVIRIKSSKCMHQYALALGPLSRWMHKAQHEMMSLSQILIQTTFASWTWTALSGTGQSHRPHCACRVRCVLHQTRYIQVAVCKSLSGLNLHDSGMFDYIPSILAIGGCNWFDFLPLRVG